MGDEWQRLDLGRHGFGVGVMGLWKIYGPISSA
jgi:hypothetical protein